MVRFWIFFCGYRSFSQWFWRLKSLKGPCKEKDSYIYPSRTHLQSCIYILNVCLFDLSARVVYRKLRQGNPCAVKYILWRLSILNLVFAFRTNLSIRKATEKEVQFKYDDKMLKNFYTSYTNLENADKKLRFRKSRLVLVVNAATARI